VSILEDRIILLPPFFDSCPKYWQNFVSSIIHHTPDTVSTLLFNEYNVIKYYIKDTDSNNFKDTVRVIEFATPENMLFFIFKWS